MENKKSLANVKTLVIGLGISGRAAAGFLLRKGAIVTGVDQNRQVIAENQEVAALCVAGMRAFTADQITQIDHFDLIVVSPGVPQSNMLYQKAVAAGIEVIGEIELACRFLKNKVLGITGTNGKTTVTLLVTHMLNHCGFKAAALGNSGVALTSQEAEDEILSDSIMVAELSSYQLETMRSEVLDAAVVLNVTPDHLDRYQTMNAYAKAKMHISDCLKRGGELYIERQCACEYKELLADKKHFTYGFREGCDLFCDLQAIVWQGKREVELPQELAGKMTHDVENFLAAYALCRRVGADPSDLVKAYRSFKKPSHRIEFVRELSGVKYFDDSKGTNLDAVVKAVDTMAGPVVLIAGGVDKGAAYTPWIAAFADKVTCICVIGQAAPMIEHDLKHAIPVKRFDSLESAVVYAAQAAQPGSNVLLSPGCSSFDMFKDYAHRGKEFQRIVRSL